MLSCGSTRTCCALQQAVDALADLADELAGLVELEQPRAAVRERRATCRACSVRIAGARVDEDVALRIGRHAGRFAEVDVRPGTSAGSAPSRTRISGTANWARQRARRRQHRRADQQDSQVTFHDALIPPYRAADEVCGFCGFSMIFCARHAVISETKSSFGLRQSISWTVLNSPSALPALPNLPMIVPSSSIL